MPNSPQRVTTQEAPGPLVTKDTLIGDAVTRYPAVADVMLKYGLHCVGCHVNPYESIEQGALAHGMEKEVISKMVAEVNEAAKKQAGAAPKGIALTEKAAAKIKSLIASEHKEGQMLRVSAAPGGCSGYNYGLSFDADSDEEDSVITSHGVKLVVSKDSLALLSGMEIDYVDGLDGSGFKFNNPNAQNTCGCGKSFS